MFLLKIFPTINSGFYYVRAFSVLLVSMHLNTTYLVSASGASRALVRAATGLVYLIISRWTSLKHGLKLFSPKPRLTGNREEAYDLCQETFIRAFRCIHRFKQNASFQTWVCRIGVNTALTYLKRERRRRFFSLDEIDTELAPEEVISHLSIDPDVDQAIFFFFFFFFFNQSLQVFSSKHRAVVVMSEIEGMDHAAIAEVMQCSEGTVRSRLHYAKQQLKQFLKNYLPKK